MIYYLEQENLPPIENYLPEDIVVILKNGEEKAYRKCGDSLWASSGLPIDTEIREHVRRTKVAIDSGLLGGDTTAAQIDYAPHGNISSITVQGALNELEDEKIASDGIRSAGVVVPPAIVDNGNGSVTVGVGEYSLYDNTTYSGIPKTYTVTGGTFVLVDNSSNYIQVRYNAGIPILELISSVPPASTTDSDRLPVFSLFRYGTDIHYFNWDHLALGLAEKINQRLRRTDRFHIDNGLALSESATRLINISAGGLWAGANLVTLSTLVSDTAADVHFYYHNAGVWNRIEITQYNNTQYDDGTNLQTLSNGRYAVNWVYRGVHVNGAMYVVLGNGNYTLTQAQTSAEPVRPSEIATQAVLVGRIIVLKNATTATEIDRVSDVTFVSSTAANHNDLGLIQGGSLDQYYHLVEADYNRILNKTEIRKITDTLITYQVLPTDHTIRASSASGNINITLPNATTCTGQVFVIKKYSSDANTVTINTLLSQNIDISLTKVLSAAYSFLRVQSNGIYFDTI